MTSPIDIPSVAAIATVVIAVIVAVLFTIALAVCRIALRKPLVQRSKYLTAMLGLVASGVPGVIAYELGRDDVSRGMSILSVLLVLLAPLAAMKRTQTV